MADLRLETQNAPVHPNSTKHETKESFFMHQKRPMTSYAAKSSSGPNLLSSQVIRGGGSAIRPQILSALPQKTLGPGHIRPSTTLSTSTYQSDNTMTLGTLRTKKTQSSGQVQLISAPFPGELKIVDKNAQKKIPNNILHDKEKLYETQLQLRNIINNVQEENLKLRTKNINLEREAKKFERIIEEGNNGKDNGKTAAGQQQKENALSIRLRKQLKESLREVESKTFELENFKRQVTTTRLQELEIEATEFSEECLNLKSKLDQCLKLNQVFGFDSVADDGSTVKSGEESMRKLEGLKNDNLEMAVLIQRIEREKNDYAAKAKEVERQLLRSTKDKIFMQKQLHNLEEELKKIQQDNLYSPNGKKALIQQQNNAQQTSNLNEQIQKLKQEIERINKENAKFSSTLAIRADRVKELEDKQRRDQQEWQDRYETVRAQKEMLERNYAQEQILRQSLEEQVIELERQLELSKQQEKEAFNGGAGRKQNDENISRRILASSTIISQQQPNGQSQPNIRHQSMKRHSLLMQKKLLPRVEHTDVTKIGLDIKFSLVSQGISFEDIDRYLITPELKKKGRANILDIVSILQREPFNLREREHTIAVARYTIEDNSEAKIVFDENRSNDISVIRTVFRNLVGKYECFKTTEEVLRLHEELMKLITQQQQGIKQNIEYFRKQSKESLPEGECYLEEFMKSIGEFGQGITQRQSDYLTMKIYQESQNTNQVFYLRVLQLFEQAAFSKLRDHLNEKDEEDEEGSSTLNQQQLDLRGDTYDNQQFDEDQQ